MTTNSFAILDKFHRFLVEDSDYLLRVSNKGTRDDTKRGTRDQFARYLVSVATQPIGLQASIAPFNCSQEQMLAYLMEVFEFNQAQIRGMRSDSDSATKPSIRKHSWRPEIKFKVGRPAFYHKEQEFLDNLSVRVYLFKDQSQVENNDSPPSVTTNEDNKRLSNIFQRMKPDHAILTRPVAPMLRELRFTRVESTKSTISVTNTSTDMGGLNVRRSYTDPKTGHILRFEFWLNSSMANIGALQSMSRYVSRSKFCCSFKRARGIALSSSGKLLYGFINVRLTEVPAYAIKVTYPILSMKEQRVNTSEICLEFRNRQISDDLNGGKSDHASKQGGVEETLSAQPSSNSVINHMRLYVCCIVFQMLTMRRCTEINELREFDRIISSMTLDNLFYLPAHTLINQHRLQNNLKQLEDQSLRRAAILLLLTRLNNIRVASVNQVLFESWQLLLVALAQHEYVIAHRLYDSKTMQQIEIFDDNPEADTSKDVVIDIELAAAADFCEMISREQLANGWLSMLANKSNDLAKTLTLSYLRLAEVMISHMKSNNFVAPKLKSGVLQLEKRIDKLLAEVVSSYLKTMLTQLVKEDHTVTSPRKEGLRLSKDFNSIRTSRVISRKANKHMNMSSSWQKMARDLQQIDHDLSLHWAPSGIGGVGIDNSNLFGSSTMKDQLTRLVLLVRSKMDQYLDDKYL